MTRSGAAQAAAIALLVFACAGDAGQDEVDDSFLGEGGKADQLGIEGISPEASGVLRLANRGTLELLRDEVGLTAKAANNIVAHRGGYDGEQGGDDDNQIENLPELDAIPFVGPVAFDRLLTFATSHGHVGWQPVAEKFPEPVHCQQNMSFDLSLEHDLVLEVDSYISGAETPAEFRLVATTPDGAQTSSELTEYPTLALPQQPGDSVHIEVEHVAQAPCYRAQFLVERPLAVDQLGACGLVAREVFLHWAQSQYPWRRNIKWPFLRELPPAPDRGHWFQIARCHGVSCLYENLELMGTLAGPLGPIVQVANRDGNIGLPPESGRLRLAQLLFFDRYGQVVRSVHGQARYRLPNGNLLVSVGMRNDGPGDQPWDYTHEEIAAVTPTGEIAWQLELGGTAPQAAIVTAQGSYVFAYIDRYLPGRWGIRAIDPVTGYWNGESFVDRASLCTEASTLPACVASKQRVLARFDQWWQQHDDHDCDGSTCTTATLEGWLVRDGKDILEVSLSTYAPLLSKRRFRNTVLFMTDQTTEAIGGKIYRELEPGRLLISTAMADSGWIGSSEVPWYYADEKLAVIGPRPWAKQVGGKPALAEDWGSAQSRGFLLTDNRLLWYAVDIGAMTLDGAVLDLETGATVTGDEPPPADLCVP